MKKTTLVKIVALIMALATLLGTGTLTVFADSGTAPTVTDKTIADYSGILAAVTYKEYSGSTVFQETKRATSGEITIDGTAYDTELSSNVRIEEGLDGLYTESSGKAVWHVDIPEQAKYAIRIEYYSVYTGKATSIEREMLLNGETPFSEANSMKISKTWSANYVEGSIKLTKKMNAADMITSFQEAGMEARLSADQKYIIVKKPEVWTETAGQLVNKYDIRFFQTDVSGEDELHISASQTPTWSVYEFKDGGGLYAQPFEFVFKAGDNTIALIGLSEPMVVRSITLYPLEDYISYEEYLARYEGVPEGKDSIRIEGEYANYTSTSSVYAIEDRTSALTTPADTSRTLLNTIGGEKWQTAGQWVQYKFKVENSGMYDIVSRFRQNILDGMYVCRSLQVFSKGAAEGSLGYYNGIPFEEASRLRYDYSSKWQVGSLTDGEKDFLLYFEAGVEYTIQFEVVLGSMGDIVIKVEAILDAINRDYLQIIKLTGASPDTYRDYGFSRTMPQVLKDFVKQSDALEQVSAELKKAAGSSSSNAATLDKVANLLDTMGRNPGKIASKLSTLKSYIGTIGTFLSDAKTQPLQIDSIVIQGKSAKNPRANAGFFQALFHEISGFFQSFRRNYDASSTVLNEDGTQKEEKLEVWVASARDQYNVIRSLITNDFAVRPETSNISCNLKLVAASTLLPSIFAGMGPDVYLGLDQGTVINYAVRGALETVEDMKDFDTTVESFNHSAMITLQIEDQEGTLHTYGLPETQTFPMMFIRVDILSDLGVEIPKTWGDIYSIITQLQANNMQIGYTIDYKIFLYQMGGELFADNGMRINLDSKIALEAFEKTCDFFTQYSFPYTYDAANRFRTGEIPIIISDYVALYNTLKVFATEIEGLWTFVPLPGIESTDENGNKTINNCSISVVTASVMIKGAKAKGTAESAWKYMQWFTGAECQSSFANEMVAILGNSAKQASANREALSMMTWTSKEYEEVIKQFNNLAAVPNYPGSYYIDRYTKFAFLDAYNNSANPVTALQGYINQINNEITRKRKEFGLETLEIGETLASKRIEAALKLIEELENSGKLTESGKAAVKTVKSATNRQNEVLIRNSIAGLQEADPVLFADVIKLLTEAANALATY